MNILGVLQNQWFNNPVRAAQIYASHGTNYDRIAQLNGAYLFMGCKTGRVLVDTFGDEWCDKIIWWEASPKKAGKSSGAFPAEPEWVATAINHFKPEVIIAFGKIAQTGVAAAASLVREDIYDVIHCPHPAARFVPVSELQKAQKRFMACLTRRGYEE